MTSIQNDLPTLLTHHWLNILDIPSGSLHLTQKVLLGKRSLFNSFPEACDYYSTYNCMVICYMDCKLHESRNHVLFSVVTQHLAQRGTQYLLNELIGKFKNIYNLASWNEAFKIKYDRSYQSGLHSGLKNVLYIWR